MRGEEKHREREKKKEIQPRNFIISNAQKKDKYWW